MSYFGWILMKVLKISTINKFYNRNKHLKDIEFLDSILDETILKINLYKSFNAIDIPIEEKQKLKLSNIKTSNTTSCTPNSGCC